MKTKFLILGALLALQGATTRAQIPITTNTVTPPIGAYDQYYLPGPVDEATGAMTPTGTANASSGANDVLTYVAGDQASKGQSFTTGSNPLGYTISSVTVRHILWTNFLSNGTWMSALNGSSFLFRFGTISGTNANGTNMTITAILTTNATYSGSALSMSGGSGTGIYFTFDLSGAGLGTLSPNTTYFFEMASTANPPYFELHNTRTNATSYTGGKAFYGDTTANLDQSGVVNLSPSGGEFAFDAALSAVGAPSVVAVANSASGSAGQTFTVTATVTPGLGTVTNVSIDLSAIGGSAAASLVLSNANVYTNTFTVPSGAPFGNAYLIVTAKDTTPLAGTYGILFAVLPSSRVWNGGSSVDSKWSSSLNWQGGLAPSLSGNNVIFAGTTRLTPDLDLNYSITGMAFSNTAGSFIIGSSTASTLTNGSGGIVNNSANAQTLNVPIVMSAAQTFNAAAGNLTLNGNVTGGAALTKTGNGTLTFAGTGTNTLGDLLATTGLVKVAAGTLNVSATQGNTRIDNNGNVEVDAGATLNVTNGGNAWFPVGDTAGTTNILTVAGGTVTIQDNWGIEVPRQGNAILNINSGSMTVNDSGGIGLIIGDQGTAQTGAVNLNGGTLVVNRISANNGTSTFYFNGGTLKPVFAGTFFPNSTALAAYVRDGGAMVDTSGLDVTIGQPLAHSAVVGDNALDGGLTKIGNGTLTLSGGYDYTGPTRVLGGGLNLDPSLVPPGTYGDLVVSNATLTVDASSGIALPAANVTLNTGATLTLTNTAGATAISGTGNLLVGTSTTLNLNYGSLSGNPSAAAVSVAGSLPATGTNNVINISGTGFTASQFPLVKYGSGSLASISGFKLGTLPPGVNGVLVNNTTNQSLDFNVTFIGQNLIWYGTNALWDINTTYNWNAATAKYLEYGSGTNVYGDLVTFDDTLYNGVATSVNLTTNLHPSLITVNGSLPYSFIGAGSIAGGTSLIMNDTGSLTLGTSNSYTGGTFVNAGTLVITNDSALGASSSLLTLAGGTLQVAGNTVSTRPVTFTANSTVDILAGVTAQWTGLVTGSGGLTKTDNGTLVLSGIGANTIGDLQVSRGLLTVANGNVTVNATQGNSKIDAGSSVEVDTGGVLNITNGVNSWFPVGDTAGTTNTLTIAGGTVNIVDDWGIEVPRQGTAILNINSGSMTVNDIGGFHVGLIIGDMNTAQSGTVNLNGGTLVVDQITSNNGTNTFCFNGGTLRPAVAGAFFPGSAPLTAYVRNGGAIVDTVGLNVTIGQALVHSAVAGDNAIDGGLTKIGSGTLNLNAVNTYTGPTVINAGTLSGTGTIAGALTNNATLVPGNGSSGTLTVNGNITLKPGSTNTFAVNGTTLAKSSVVAGANVTYGGMLNIVPGGTFTAGQQFQLFSGTGATNTGNFASIAGSPGSGLGFTFTNGMLSVAATMASNPTNITFSVSGSTLSLSWPADHLGWILQSQTNSLSSGLSTNWVDVTGSAAITSTSITISPVVPTVFYRLRHP